MKMFLIEDPKRRQAPGDKQLHSQMQNCYLRLSFVNVLHLIKRNVVTDWVGFNASLQQKIANDKVSSIGAKTVIETTMHLDSSNFMPGRTHDTTLYSYVTLSVPRKDIDIFFQPDSAPVTALHISIFKPNTNIENVFFSIDGFFGTLKSQTDPEQCGEFIEDPRGWFGSSDLFITCQVPSHILEGKKWHIGLCITHDNRGEDYIAKLGPRVVVSSFSGKNRNRVTISKAPPGIPINRLQQTLETALGQLSLTEGSGSADGITIAATKLNSSIALQATYRFSSGTEETKALQNAAFVTLSDITPCSVLLNIGEFSHRLIFPYPIDEAKATTKIARKSLWIQVSVPVSSTLKPGGYDASPFPVMTSQDQQPVIWSLPRINLSTLPRVKCTIPGWFNLMQQQLFSAREKLQLSTQEYPTNDFPSILFRMKCNTGELMIQMYTQKVCGFFVEGVNGFGDLLFISNGLRHSRETHSVVFDGWVVSDLRNEGLSIPFDGPMMMALPITRSEHILWKKIMPAAVESCRREWKHNASCAYRNAQAPLSIEPHVSPICKCGEGKDVADFS